MYSLYNPALANSETRPWYSVYSLYNPALVNSETRIGGMVVVLIGALVLHMVPRVRVYDAAPVNSETRPWYSVYVCTMPPWLTVKHDLGTVCTCVQHSPG